jgi:fumarate reductase subunit C
MVLGVCVVVHLVTMILAVRGGLSAAEILERTRGNVAWGVFYTVFVVAIAVHAPIGLRTIFAETLRTSPSKLNALALFITLVLLVLGLRAVWAVVA